MHNILGVYNIPAERVGTTHLQKANTLKHVKRTYLSSNARCTLHSYVPINVSKK